MIKQARDKNKTTISLSLCTTTFALSTSIKSMEKRNGNWYFHIATKTVNTQQTTSSFLVLPVI